MALHLTVNIGFQVLFHSPPGVLFTFPSLYCSSIGHLVVFRLGGWSLPLPARFLVSRGTLDTARCSRISLTGLSPSLAGFPNTILLSLNLRFAVRNPDQPKLFGLASSHFARRYFGNRCFFLFLRLLRCFSSPGSLPYVMDWRMDTWSLSRWVSPFGYLRINGYLLLPAAFRSLSRPSSAPSAKASSLRSY